MVTTKRDPLVEARARLRAAGKRWASTREAHQRALDARDIAIYEAVAYHGMTLSEAATLAGMQRAAAYYAKLRGESKRGAS